jgi:hypothetical protein
MDDFAMGRTPEMIVAPRTLINFEGSIPLSWQLDATIALTTVNFQHAYTA